MSLEQAKRWGKRALGRGLPWRLAANIVRPTGVSVLTYHRIIEAESIFDGRRVDEFRWQMEWVAEHCQPIQVDEFQSCLGQSTRTGRPPVLVTFDDGYRDYFTSAYPILRALSIPAVLFVSTRMIDDGSMIWPDEITQMVHAASVGEVRIPWQPDQVVKLRTPKDRKAMEQSCKRFLKSVEEVQRVQYVAELRSALDIQDEELSSDRQMLSWDEVRSVMPHTTIGAHGHDHLVLSRLTDAEAERQIVKCAQRIEEETGVRPKYFAYPNGQVGDYNERTKEFLRRHGFELGFSCRPGVHPKSGDRYEICRHATGARDLGDFAALVCGLDAM